MLEFINGLSWEGQAFVLIVLLFVVISIFTIALYLASEFVSHLANEVKKKKAHREYGFEYKIIFKKGKIYFPTRFIR